MSLALATAAIDVHPPRAGRLWRLQLAYWRMWHAIAHLMTRPIPGLDALASFSNRADHRNFDLPTMLRCIVPGWPQFHRGDGPRGAVFLFSYLLFVLPSIVLAGTWLGSLLLGLGIAMHIVTVCDAVVATFATPGDRVGFTMACGLVLFLVVYLPLGWAISRVATPIRINATIPPFQQGEVLWYSRLGTPERGDLVMYTLPTIRYAGRAAGGGAANYVFQGDWIGRVIATAGQTVGTKDGRWLVDGMASEWQPLTPGFGDGSSWVVPQGHVLVLPEGLVPLGAAINNEVLGQIYFVPVARIAGRLYFRSLPFSQMALVQ
jgi:hypothetical protein